jgi:hypothetical protein
MYNKSVEFSAMGDLTRISTFSVSVSAGLFGVFFASLLPIPCFQKPHFHS